MACVVRLSPLEAKLHVWLLPPPLSSWRLRQYRLHSLHGWLSHLAWQWSPTWLVFGDCDWAIRVHCEVLQFAVFLNEKLDLWLCSACWPFLTVLSQVFWQKCLVEMPESVWVPFPLLGLLELCQLAYLQCWVLCLTHPRLLPLPAPVAQWLARRTVGRKVWGSNPIRVMWDFSALAGSYPELGVLWAQWEGWNHTAELHPLNGCVFEGVALITWPTLQVPQFPGLVNTGIIVTVSVVCGPVK